VLFVEVLAEVCCIHITIKLT